MSGLLYVFYGDDFTGSTDVLESLALAGIESRSLPRPPTQRHLGAVPKLPAMGIAGDSRSQTPEWMSVTSAARIRKTKSFRSTLDALQNLLNLRQFPHPWQHRPGNGGGP